MRTPSASWTIPSGSAESNSILFGDEGIVGGYAPAMAATTTKLLLEVSIDNMSVLDADATFAPLMFQGTQAEINVSATQAQADIMQQLARAKRVRVVASTGSADVNQDAEKVIEPFTARV